MEDITYASECYSVGTTLAEIVYRTDNFDTVDLKNNEEVRLSSLQAFTLFRSLLAFL